MTTKTKIKIILCSIIWTLIIASTGDVITGYFLTRNATPYKIGTILNFPQHLQINSVRLLGPDEFDIARACYDNGLGELCLSDLWALGRIESYNNKNAINVNTNNTIDLGYFQISSIHNVSLSCKANFYCSAQFVIKRLIASGYLDQNGRVDALGLHHSSTPFLKERYINKLSNYLTLK